jgi:hypothetical protein
MDRKYLGPPFDMSEYIFGRRFVLGGIDFDLDDEKEKPIASEDEKNSSADPQSPLPERKRVP